MKKIFNRIKWFLTPPGIKKLIQEVGAHRQKIVELEHVVEKHGSLLLGHIDVHMRYQPSIAMVSFYNTKSGKMEAKCFEIDQEKGVKGLLDFVHSFRLKSERVHFDADPGMKRMLHHHCFDR